jgi:formylmethanofuran dehydrogenase subunit E
MNESICERCGKEIVDDNQTTLSGEVICGDCVDELEAKYNV